MLAQEYSDESMSNYGMHILSEVCMWSNSYNSFIYDDDELTKVVEVESYWCPAANELTMFRGAGDMSWSSPFSEHFATVLLGC